MSMGGLSKSSSSSSSQDGRVVVGEGGQNTSATVSGKNNKVNLTSTDHGAVAGGLALALKGVEGAQKLAGETIAANGSLLEGSLKMAAEQQEKTTQALENIKGNDVRVLIIAGLAVVGIAASQMLKRG